MSKGEIGDFVRRCYVTNPAATVMLGLILALWIFSLAVCLLLGPDSFGYMLYWKRSDYWNDHFNSVVHCYEGPYTIYELNYPGLAVVIYEAIGELIIPASGISRVAGQEDIEYVEAVRDSAVGTWSYLLMAVTVMVLLAVLSYSILRKRGFGKYSPVAAILVVFSFPFLFAFDRGNSIILAVLLILVFIRWYDSESRYARWGAYIAIALAVGIKIYPAYFLILLLRDRRLKDFAACLALSLAMVFLPAFLVEGGPLEMLRNIFSYSSSNTGDNGLVNITDLVCDIWLYLTSETEEGALCISVALAATLAFEFAGLAVTVWCRDLEKWEVLALISCMAVLGPGVGTDYLFCYMLFPALYFMTSKTGGPRWTAFFAVCFAALLCMLPGLYMVNAFGFYGLWDKFSTTLRAVFLFAMALALLRKGIRRMHRKNEEQIPRPAAN